MQWTWSCMLSRCRQFHTAIAFSIGFSLQRQHEQINVSQSPWDVAAQELPLPAY
ncbi:hypothetical protein BofuT4_uP062410.1 [Botrytis cinerea T4]|uniref:Uncharacterized protein n=1 Tax=Botryotinia fuckeliana (strain T4) TaxID=999810 RepID=G2XTH5_BOTF4|nr:hypothetical protein BofuT4_uP062410.1 [Botrytis cinerea T4]